MDESIFSIVDATNENHNIEELIKLGCTRSSHVGLLANSNTTLAPLIYYLPIHYHEFLRNSDDKYYNVCNFQILKDDLNIEEILISNDKGVWPPLAKWNSEGRNKITQKDSRFQSLSEICSSPFSFHLAATKKLFSNSNSVTLSSTNFIKSIDKVIGSTDAMKKILQLIGSKNSKNNGRIKTFYRLIDESGITWYQKSNRIIANNKIEIRFENDFSMSVDAAIDSVLETYMELSILEKDPSYKLSKRPRVVMDTAFYILMDFILSGRISVDKRANGRKIFVSYHLAGFDSMNYLVYNPKLAEMYKTQVEKLINIISSIYFTDTPWILKLVKPIVTIGHTQYSYVQNADHAPGNMIFPDSVLKFE